MSDSTTPSSSRPGSCRPPSQFDLLGQRRFAPFFATQFFGALNDNVFKIGFTSLITFQAAQFGGGDAKTAAFLISAVFILPFVLFSATAGQIADKYDKARLTRFVKSFEIVLVAIGAAGFVSHEAWLLYACTFMMGMHSTLFGPVKYAYLPQHLSDSELVGGNGLVEMGTFVAILMGTIVGGSAAGIDGRGEWLLAGCCIVIAVVGRFASSFVPATPALQPDLVINWNPCSEIWRNLRLAAQDRSVFLGLLGISWLWFVGATFLTSFFPFAKDVLSANPDVVTVLLATFSIGIGLGSMLCERLSQRRVEMGLVPLGSIGLSVFAIDLYFASHALPVQMHPSSIGTFIAQPAHWRILADLFLLAMFGGFYSVPLYALIQRHSAPTHRARIIAANNILNALFMVASALMAMGLASVGVGIPGLFLATGLLNAVVAACVYSLAPEFLLRFIAWMLMHTFYRIRLVHRERIPEHGAAVLVCNRVSHVDALLIAAASPRLIRFAVNQRIPRTRFANWTFRHGNAIPITPCDEDPAGPARTGSMCEAALKGGALVCFFLEDELIGTGDVDAVRRGVTEMLVRMNVPIVPMALGGAWGSWFARDRDAGAPRRMRRGAMSRLTLAIGETLDATTVTPTRLRQAVVALRDSGARE